MSDPVAESAVAGIVEGIDVDAVHDAVASCPGVAGVGGGGLGALATYLPGRRIPGVRVSPEAVEVEIRMQWGAAARQVVADVRAALAPVVRDRRVDLTLADIELPGEAT